MKRSIFHASTVNAAAAALALISWSSSSFAEEESKDSPPAPPQGAATQPQPTLSASPPVVITTPPPPRDVIVTEEKTPNAGLISGGALMFGLPYVGSVIVGAASDRPGDQNLFIPIVGPWLDLANRGKCAGPRCDNETGNKVLLVADGIFQGVGALQIVGGFLFPSTRTVARSASVHVTPTGSRSSVGISAYGTF